MLSQRHMLDAIGNTPLVEMRRIVPPGSARIVAKLESANPTGSMKDRLARMIVQRAAASGRYAPPRNICGRWWRVRPGQTILL
jgi:cysteine synthase